MKKIAIISPLRGTPAQFAEIEKRIDSFKASWQSAEGVSPDAMLARLRASLRAELFQANQVLAETLCREVILQGFRPVAGHLFYPRFLDDAREEERNLGMAAGREDFAECSAAWVYRVHGVSNGMEADIAYVAEHGVPYLTPPNWAER